MQLLAQSGDTASVSADDTWGGNELAVVRGDRARPSLSGSLSPSSPSSPSKRNNNNNNNNSPSATNASNPPREKPVKVVPCPRCESMNTKFCYYNNYSVTQPRHFCRQCQRYWTAGGTLRNVPVGGGSRKKNRQSRSSEPYTQRNAHGASPLGLPSPSASQSLMQNVPGHGHFQQMLAQDATGLSQLNFTQLPAFGFHSFPLEHPQSVDLGSAMQQQQAMYGSGMPMQGQQQQAMPQYYQLQPQQHQESVPFQHDAVKTEYWPHPGMVASSPSKSSPRFESSMLLNMGLDSRGREPQQAQPQSQQQQQQQQPGSEVKAAGWDQSQQQSQEAKPVGATTKNGSPPHGSSTIEEEGSTPTNGYSNSGYDEGDAVSSMWPSLHDDMYNLFP